MPFALYFALTISFEFKKGELDISDEQELRKNIGGIFLFNKQDSSDNSYKQFVQKYEKETSFFGGKLLIFFKSIYDYILGKDIFDRNCL